MLTPEPAVAAAVGLAAVSLLTAYGVSTYDLEFANTTSWMWSIYAVTALATYLCGIAMALVQSNDIAYMVISLAVVSTTSLAIWMMNIKRVERRTQTDASTPILQEDAIEDLQSG